MLKKAKYPINRKFATQNLRKTLEIVHELKKQLTKNKLKTQFITKAHLKKTMPWHSILKKFHRKIIEIKIM